MANFAGKFRVMNFDFKQIFTATMILFAVIDIVGSIPIIIKLRLAAGHIQSGKATLVAGAIMILFLFVGESILSLIGIDVNSFAVAGSFVLLFLALEMILGIKLYKDEEPETASIVPLAFPVIAGAGTLTTILSLTAEYAVENVIVAILVNLLLVYSILKMTKRFENFLGKAGISILQKVFGVILLAIAVKLFTSNIGALLN